MIDQCWVVDYNSTRSCEGQKNKPRFLGLFSSWKKYFKEWAIEPIFCFCKLYIWFIAR
jgi:hypothetical protein